MFGLFQKKEKKPLYIHAKDVFSIIKCPIMRQAVPSVWQNFSTMGANMRWVPA